MLFHFKGDTVRLCSTDSKETFQLSRFDRETHGLGCHLTVYHTVNQKTLKLPKNSAKYEGKSNNLCS